MNSLKSVLQEQIEELRLNLIRIKVGKSYTDPEVVAASQALDAVLDKYQEMIIKKVNNEVEKKRTLGSVGA